MTLQVDLQVDKPTLQLMSAEEFVKSFQQQEHGFMYLLYAVQGNEEGKPSSDNKVIPEDSELKKRLQQLLDSYEDLSQTPVELPPHRDIEHAIELKEGLHWLEILWKLNG